MKVSKLLVLGMAVAAMSLTVPASASQVTGTKETTERYCQMLWMDFFRLKSGAASRAVLIFSSAQPPKPDSGVASIWLRLGGDDIRTGSPKAIPSLSLPLILSR